MNSISKKILFLKTAYVIPFKTLTEVLSNVLTETLILINCKYFNSYHFYNFKSSKKYIQIE